MDERFVGKMTWYTGENGYGFLVSENGQDVLVHYVPKLGEGFRILTEGQQYEFSIVDGINGRVAVDVVALP